jgi:hypothetical protein
MEYIKNKEFMNELIISKQNGQLTEKATNMFVLLAEKYSHKCHTSMHRTKRIVKVEQLWSACFIGEVMMQVKAVMHFHISPK